MYKIFRNSYTSSCIRTTCPANSVLHHFRTYRPTSCPFRHSQRFNHVHNHFLLREYTFELFKAYQSVQYYRARDIFQVSHGLLHLYTTVFRYYIKKLVLALKHSPSSPQNVFMCCPIWPSGLAAAHVLELRVRISPGVSVVHCLVEVSASGCSLVQKSPSECGVCVCVCVSECDREASIMRRPWPTSGWCAMGRGEKKIFCDYLPTNN